MKMVQSNYTPGKVKNLLEGEEPAPLFYSKAFGKYHCMVEAGFNTESQKQMQFAQLIQLRELGVQIPDDVLIDAATLQNKDKLTERLQQQQQAQQQQAQHQMQSQMQLQQAQIQLAHARAGADRGLEVERTSRVEENRALAERQHEEAIKESQLATLNLVKAMKELEDMDLGHLQKLVDIQQLLKASTQPQTFQNGSESVR
jgi:uncharacterized transporter YbjL